MAFGSDTGPWVITGNLNQTFNTEPDQGPSLTFMGDGILDPRFVYTIGSAASTGQNKIYGHTNHAYICLVDYQPQTLSTTLIVNAQSAPVVPAGGTLAMTMVTSQAAGYATNIPVIPQGSPISSASVVNCAALDFGFATVSTTSASNVVTVGSAALTRFMFVGQDVIIAGGGANANSPLITKITAISGTNVTLRDNAGNTNSSARMGAAIPSVGLAAWPWRQAGIIAVADPYQGLARALQVTSSGAGGTGFTVLVRGYDIWGYPMAERIAVPNSASSTAGLKAFKYVASVTLEKSGGGTFSGQTISVGTTDVIGLNFRSDFWEYLNVYFNGSYVTSSTGWTAGLAYGTASTATTADVRGTYALQAASDGTKRLAMFLTLPQYQIVGATNLNAQTLFGQAQFTT